MKSGAAFVGFLFAAAVGFGFGYAVGTGKQGASPSAPVADNKPSDPGKPATAEDIFKVPVGTSFAKGPADALVTIVEFSDFQCPFCSRVGPTLKQIHDTYKNDVRVVFKHQPLPFHQQAPLASEYALAAGEQGKFWEMHDKLFGSQSDLSPDALKRYASELGLDQGKIDAFIESGKGKKMIQEDQALAQKVGATGTPAFFINGVKLSGAQPFASFQKVIDEQLTKAKGLVGKGVSKNNVYAEVIKNGRDSAPPPSQERPKQPPSTRQKVDLVENTPAKGSKQALVTIVAWSDFQCPFCSRVVPTLEQINKEYGDKVQVQFRHQPLSFHNRAMPAAKASMAAHKQGKFWEMHDKLFENQKALEDADLERYAKELGLNVSKWKADLEAPDLVAQINKDVEDGNKFGARGTPTLFVNGVPVRGAQPFAAFKTVIDKELVLAEKLMKEGVARKDVYAEILKREGGKTVDDPSGAPAAAPAAPTGPVTVDISRAPLQGKKDAPIKVVTYSDFECPFCGRVNPSIEQIKKEYGDKVVVAFKHYPLPFHPNATPAAIASLAAHRQGKFWEMHEKLFANQKALTKDDFLKYAKDLGLDVGKFEKDLADPALDAWVKQDTAEGSKNGVNGTPATFINGRLVSGAQPFPAFKAIIDEELNKKS